MPLPFSFSAQRAVPVPDAPLGMGSAYTNPHELLGLTEQPGAVKDPAFATPVFEAGLKPAQSVDYQPSQASFRQPAQAPPFNGHAHMTLGQAPTTHFNAPVSPGASATETEHLLRELSGQVEQLRNDFFSAATTISALKDRVERLEGRGASPSGASTEVAALRADFEAWIAQHLEVTVEHCMRRVWARASLQQTPASPAPTA